MVGNFCHEFFKVYLSHISSKQLGLPPAFVSELGGKIPNNCTIEDSDGKIWKVKLEGSEVGLVVVNGWEEFASHHLLVDGDFLVFHYDGDSHFGVKIYGMNGLQKRKAPDAVVSTIPAKKERKQGVEELNSSMPLRPRSQGPPPSRVYKTRNSKMPLIKAEEVITTPSYPYFKTVIPDYRVSCMHVPSKFVMDHIKPKVESAKQRVKKVIETQLLVADNKWTVRLNVYFKHCDRGLLSAGWCKFVRDNCLEVGDECLFELINNDPVTMKVSIFKHNSE